MSRQPAFVPVDSPWNKLSISLAIAVAALSIVVVVLGGGEVPQEREVVPTSSNYDADRPEEEIRRDCRMVDVHASDKRRRAGGHGYSGGDGFTNIQ